MNEPKKSPMFLLIEATRGIEASFREFRNETVNLQTQTYECLLRIEGALTNLTNILAPNSSRINLSRTNLSRTNPTTSPVINLTTLPAQSTPASARTSIDPLTQFDEQNHLTFDDFQTLHQQPNTLDFQPPQFLLVKYKVLSSSLLTLILLELFSS
jgi:hypothetical protein